MVCYTKYACISALAGKLTGFGCAHDGVDNTGSKRLTLEGAGADSTTIDASSGDAVTVDTVDDVSITGVTVDGAGTDGSALGILIDDGSATITDTTITNTYGAVQTQGGAEDGGQVTVDNIEVTNSVFGVGVQYAGEDIIRNSSFDVTDQGIGFSTEASNVTITQNNITVSGGSNLDYDAGIDFTDFNSDGSTYTDVTITENDISSTDVAIRSVGPVENVTINNNDIAGDSVHVNDQPDNLSLDTVLEDNTFDPNGEISGNQIIPVAE